MAWTSIGQIGSDTEFPAGVNFVQGLNSSVTAGSVLVLVIAKDNQEATNGSTNEVTSVTDIGGNVWVKAAEITNSGGGVSKAGATVAVFYSNITTTLNGGSGQITANFALSVAAAASTCWQFQIAGGNTLSLMGATGQASNSYGPLTLSSFTSNEYLFFMGGALEFSSFGFTPTTNYTALGVNFANGGGTASCVAANGEFRIFTGTGDISDPLGATASADCASVFFALKEQTPAVAGNFIYAACLTGCGR